MLLNLKWRDAEHLREAAESRNLKRAARRVGGPNAVGKKGRAAHSKRKGADLRI